MIHMRSQWFKEGKNCNMSNARVLVAQFFVQPDWMICIRATPVLMVDLNFKLPNWLGWIKSLAMAWNCILSPMTFSISFPRVLSKTIGLNDLDESYNNLFGLGMITIDDLLKWFGQYPKSIQVFAIFMTLAMQTSSFKMILRWLHDSLSSPGVNKLLQLPNAILNSSFKNSAQADTCLLPILSRILISTWQWRVVLKEKWRASHKLSSERHGWLSYLIASIAGNLRLLTQFMSSQGPRLLLATSWILMSKNDFLVIITVLLNNFQSSRLLDSLYLLREQLQSSFHHFLECFVMLTLLALTFQACSTLATS